MAAAAAACLAPAGHAGEPLRPLAGAPVEAAPVFVVRLAPGEQQPLVEVTAKRDGLVVGTCVPIAQGASGLHSCRLATALPRGAYSWVLTYLDATGVGTASAPIDFEIGVVDASFRLDGSKAYVDRRLHLEAKSRGQGTYRWSFGDGTSATDPDGDAYHVYRQAGTYKVTLAVTDSAGRIGRSTLSIHVRALPDSDRLPRIAGPSAKSRLDPGYSRVATMLAGGVRAVLCWNADDWRVLNDEDPFAGTSILGYVEVAASRQLNLGPGVCRYLDLLRYRKLRPAPALSLATAVVTLTHELLHTVGYENEARTECFAMQLSAWTARLLGTGAAYARALARTFWDRGYNLDYEPEEYYSTECRNGGKLDLFPRDDGWPTPARGVSALP